MRGIFGPVVRHMWAWHKLTLPLLLIVISVLYWKHWQLGLGALGCSLGWLFTDVSGHAAIHHPHEWTAARWVRAVAQTLAVAGAAAIILWAMS